MSLPAPNYTQIPNVIFDYWMAILLPSEFKVLLCLCRKIFGWHKGSDLISNNQILKMTGLAKNTSLAALECLELHGLIEVIRTKNEYGQQPNEYRLRVDKPDQILVGGSANSEPGVVQNLNQGVVQNLHPQKKSNTKEKLTKEMSEAEAPTTQSPFPSKKKEISPEASRLADLLLSRVLVIHPKFKKPNLEKWATEFDVMHRVDKRDWKEIESMISYVFEKDAFWVGNIQSPSSLRRNFDKIWVKMKPPVNEGVNVAINRETAQEVKSLLSQKNRGKELTIFKGSVVRERDGESVSLNLPPQTFEDILANWFDLRRNDE